MPETLLTLWHQVQPWAHWPIVALAGYVAFRSLRSSFRELAAQFNRSPSEW